MSDGSVPAARTAASARSRPGSAWLFLPQPASADPKSQKDRVAVLTPSVFVLKTKIQAAFALLLPSCPMGKDELGGCRVVRSQPIWQVADLRRLAPGEGGEVRAPIN